MSGLLPATLHYIDHHYHHSTLTTLTTSFHEVRTSDGARIPLDHIFAYSQACYNEPLGGPLSNFSLFNVCVIEDDQSRRCRRNRLPCLPCGVTHIRLIEDRRGKKTTPKTGSTLSFPQPAQQLNNTMTMVVDPASRWM